MMHSIKAFVARVTRIALLSLTCLVPSVYAQARPESGFVVIANAANPTSTMERSEVSKLFLRKRSRWPNGQYVEPMDQVESSPVRRRFSNAIHEMDVPSVKSFWQELVFSGKGDPPPERASDGEVLAFVKTHPNALGYVGSSARLDGVKIILVTP